jgi:hypothetical protein
MKADEIARYLQDHPKFFEEYADLLAQLYIPHPHGGRTISITERQILTLREGQSCWKASWRDDPLRRENDAIGEGSSSGDGAGRRAGFRRGAARPLLASG